MADWQPIETAPRDGTKIFLYDHGWSQAHVGWRDVVESDEGGGAWFVEDEAATAMGDGILWPDEDQQPTLWAPLPEPPHE